MTKNILKSGIIGAVTSLLLASTPLMANSNPYGVSSGSYVPAPTAVMDEDLTSLRDHAYIQVLGGIASLSVEEEYYYSRYIVDAAVLETSGWLGEGVLGYQFSNGMYVSGSVQYTGLDIASIVSYYGTVGYKMDFDGVNPFFGLSLGMGDLSWDNPDRLFDAERVNVSSEMFWGFDFGMEYAFSHNVSFIGKFQYLMNDYQTEFGYGDLSHTSQSNFIGGFQFSF